MLKSIDDIIAARIASGIEQQTKVSLEVRAHAMIMNKELKALEIYAKTLPRLSLSELIVEYNTASDDLVENDSESRRLTEEFNKVYDEYRLAMQKNENMREAAVLKIAAIGAAMRDSESAAESKLAIEAKKEKAEKSTSHEKKPKKELNPEYKEAVLVAYGRNKGLETLRAEGYDV